MEGGDALGLRTPWREGDDNHVGLRQGMEVLVGNSTLDNRLGETSGGIKGDVLAMAGVGVDPGGPAVGDVGKLHLEDTHGVCDVPYADAVDSASERG